MSSIRDSVGSKYRSIYVQTREEVIARRDEILGGNKKEIHLPIQLNLLILGAGIHGRDVSTYRKEYPCAFIAIGDNEVRKQYAELLRDNFF